MRKEFSGRMDPRRSGVAFWQNKCTILEREVADLKKQLKEKDKIINLMLKKGAVCANKRASASSPPGGGDVDRGERSSGAIDDGNGSVVSRKKMKLDKNDKENVDILAEPEPDVPEELMKTYAQLESAEKFVQCLIRHLDKKSVLTCRLVCRRWNFAIQKFYEIHPLTYPVSVPAPLPMTSTSHQLFRGITLTPSNIQKFHKHVQQWTKLPVEKSPFLSRNLTLIPELGKGSTAAFAFFQKANHLLETFGIHEDVWYLTIVVQPEDLDMAPAPNVYYRWVQNCLVKMKNLRSVTLMGQLNPYSDYDEKELAIQMRPFKLPGIPSLEYLCLGIDNLPRKVEEQFFVKYASQSRKLRVGLETLLRCMEVTGKGLQENLRELVVLFDGENEEKHVELLLEILRAPKLQRLKMEFSEMTEEQLLSFPRKFGELVDLKIECIKVTKGEKVVDKVEGDGEGGGVGGKLKLLEINDDGLESYDFLRELQSLEYLKVRGSSKEPVVGRGGGAEGEGEGEGTGVDLREWMYGDEEGTKVYQSRIWEILGNFKEFVFMDEDPEGEEPTKIRKYTREGYNKACDRAEEEAQKFKMLMDDVEEKEKEEGRKEDWRKVLDELKKKGEEEVIGAEETTDVKMEQEEEEEDDGVEAVGGEEMVTKAEDQGAAWNEVIEEAKKKAEEAVAGWVWCDK